MHPPTWPPTISSQTQSQSPTLLSIPSHRPVRTQNSTPLRSRNGLLSNWDSRSGIIEPEPLLPSSTILSGLNRVTKDNTNSFMPSIPLLEDRMPTRTQSTIRERASTMIDDHFQPKISPDREHILKPVQRIRVQKRGFTRLSPLRASVLDSEGFINTENQEPYRESQFGSQDDSSAIRRSTSHREFKDSQSQSPPKSRRPIYSLPKKKQDESTIPKLVEANFAKYLNHLSDLMAMNKESSFSYQDQRLNLRSYDRGRDMRSGPLNILDSYRASQSPAPKTDMNAKAKRIETRVTFRNDDIIDQMVSQPIGKVFRSNSNEPFGRRHFEEILREEGEGSPFRRLTRRRLTRVENS